MKFFFVIALMGLFSPGAFADSARFECRFIGDYVGPQREILRSNVFQVLENVDTPISVSMDGITCSSVAMYRSYGVGTDGFKVTLPDGTVVEEVGISIEMTRGLRINNKYSCVCGRF